MVWALQLGRPLPPRLPIENHERSQTGLASSHAFIDGDGSGEREEAGEDESEHHFYSLYSASPSCTVAQSPGEDSDLGLSLCCGPCGCHLS